MNAKLSGADLWAQIIAMPRPHRVVDFPRVGSDGESVAQVAITVLTQEDQIGCSIETDRFVRKMFPEIPKSGDARRAYDDTYNNQAACEVLYRACRKPDSLTTPFFPSPAAIRQNLSPDEVGVLFRSYTIVQDEVGPIIAHMTEGEMEAWIRRLLEAGTRAPLAFLSWGQLEDLVCFSASQKSSFATPSSSLGQQPDDTSDTTDAAADDDDTVADAPDPHPEPTE